ncbi:MAG: helix-turn-helix transcriptional regulator [Chlamydiales bacterium]|nr:helix-turn-helix transcriptional regulator [Chlamydiales bacterium]
MSKFLRSRHVPLVKEETEALGEEFKRFLDDVEEVGSVLRALRKKKGWSLTDLAHKAGLEKSHLEAFEKGEQPIPERLAKRFAKIFNVSIRLFL